MLNNVKIANDYQTEPFVVGNDVCWLNVLL